MTNSVKGTVSSQWYNPKSQMDTAKQPQPQTSSVENVMSQAIRQRSVGVDAHFVASIIIVASDVSSKTLKKRIKQKKPIRLSNLNKRKRKIGKLRRLQISQTNKKRQKNHNQNILKCKRKRLART